MRRRGFHRSLLVLFAGAAWFMVPARAGDRIGRDVARKVFFYLPDRRAVLALGRRCLATGVPPAGLEVDRRLRQAITADFAAGRVVRVDGWLISESEARIAATLAIRR